MRTWWWVIVAAGCSAAVLALRDDERHVFVPAATEEIAERDAGGDGDGVPPRPVLPDPDPVGTGAIIEVVDEEGRPLTSGTLRLRTIWRSGGWTTRTEWDESTSLHDRAVPWDGRVLIRELPETMDGCIVEADARVPERAAPTPMRFRVAAKRLAHLRMVAALPRTAQVSVVDDVTGEPIPYAFALSPTELRRRGYMTEFDRDAPARASSSAEGSCVLDGLGPGPHVIEASAKDHACASTTWDGGPIVVRLAAPQILATLTVRVVRDDGASVVGAVVNLVSDNVRRGVDGAGVAAFRDLREGRHYGSVRTGDRCTWTFDEVDLKPGEQAARTWTLGRREIRGRVVLLPGRTPVADAWVSASGSGHGETRSAGDGRFVLSGARDETYRLSARTPDHAMTCEDRDVVPTEGEVVVEVAAAGRIVLHVGATDLAHVRDGSLSARLDSGARGTALGDDTIAFTDVPARVHVLIVAVGARSATCRVSVTSGETTVVDLDVP
jgi:hypothetical protein